MESCPRTPPSSTGLTTGFRRAGGRVFAAWTTGAWTPRSPAARRRSAAQPRSWPAWCEPWSCWLTSPTNRTCPKTAPHASGACCLAWAINLSPGPCANTSVTSATSRPAPATNPSSMASMCKAKFSAGFVCPSPSAFMRGPNTAWATPSHAIHKGWLGTPLPPPWPPVWTSSPMTPWVKKWSRRSLSCTPGEVPKRPASAPTSGATSGRCRAAPWWRLACRCRPTSRCPKTARWASARTSGATWRRAGPTTTTPARAKT